MKKATNKKELENIISISELTSYIHSHELDQSHWNWLSSAFKLSEEFIREFQHEVEWSAISMRQKLSEDFIREFQHKVHWSFIWSHQKLSENFIREFINEIKDETDWFWISRTQKLSEDFIKEFKNYVNWTEISKHYNPPNEIDIDIERAILLRYRCLVSKKPERETIIDNDDISNLKIALETSTNIDELLSIL